jgi:hypothetical protein
LVEHLLWEQGVVGSNPTIPIFFYHITNLTTLLDNLKKKYTEITAMAFLILALFCQSSLPPVEKYADPEVLERPDPTYLIVINVDTNSKLLMSLDEKFIPVRTGFYEMVDSFFKKIAGLFGYPENPGMPTVHDLPTEAYARSKFLENLPSHQTFGPQSNAQKHGLK